MQSSDTGEECCIVAEQRIRSGTRRLHLDLVSGFFPAGSAGVVLAAVLVPDAAVHMGPRRTLRLPYRNQ